MYRIFCESYKNFKNSFNGECSRLKISEPIELLADESKFKEEEKKQSEIYKKANDLICFMKENVKKFPKTKAFIWTISSRNMNGIKYGISKKEDLEEQIKLINSFLKLAYWY